jgi:NAD(P)-dependent dehydrogenase (short-subunit alcohol dehydrogenase family)
LDNQGFRVFAGVRTAEAAADLAERASPNLVPVTLDVTDPAAIAAAAATLKERLGADGLGGLVNNAGVALAGPLEALPLEEFRRQLEVNVIGALAVTRAMLPLLRQAHGRIVNVGSLNGALSLPYLGAYAASKHALEAVNDALRVELRPFGIQVAIVELGAIATPIWEKSAAVADALINQADPDKLAPYEAELAAFRCAVGGAAAQAEPVERAVALIVRALTDAKPRARYYDRFLTRYCFRGLRFVPEPIRDWFIRRSIGLPDV